MRKHPAPTAPLVAPKRCAVYCRVSSDERLDQEFNSIDAQRDAGHAFITSQRAEGWIPVGDHFEDGGYSGGNMERPALRRLLADIEAGRVDVVVVYKIDRLSRSLADFARMVDVFDRHGVSFVSVTQQFNTTTSMGRLTLNILLSFAQFEREVTGERIRDKFAASKAKGLWMGGVVPLGYRVENRQLQIEPVEAATVRRIFEKFVETRSTTEVVRWLRREGITSRKGCAFTRNALVKLLNNPMYRGEIAHKNQGKVYPGQHEALIAAELWDAVQAVFAENQRAYGTATRPRRGPEFLLAGLIETDQGERLHTNFTTKPDGVHYPYYVPRRTRVLGERHALGCIPAGQLDAVVLAQNHAALKTPEMVQAVWDAAQATDAKLDEPEVVLTLLRNLGAVWQALYPAEQQRIAQLLIKKVVVSAAAVSIVWHGAGWVALARELKPGSIGAELRELEEEAA